VANQSNAQQQGVEALHCHFFLFQCCKSQGHNDEELFIVMLYFCSSVVNPQGQDNEKFVILLFLIIMTQVFDSKAHH